MVYPTKAYNVAQLQLEPPHIELKSQQLANCLFLFSFIAIV